LIWPIWWIELGSDSALTPNKNRILVSHEALWKGFLRILNVICLVHEKQWQKVSSLWGGHVIKQNFSFAKGWGLLKSGMPILFYFCPDLIFHKWSKDPITRLTNWHPHACGLGNQGSATPWGYKPGVVVLVWRGSKVCEAIARYHRKKMKKRKSEAWFSCHVRPLEMGHSWNNRPRLPPQGWLFPEHPDPWAFLPYTIKLELKIKYWTLHNY
jgi:hypothetical protein